MRGDFSAGNDPVAKVAVPPVGEWETPANEGFKPLGIGFGHGNGAGGLRLRLLALHDPPGFEPTIFIGADIWHSGSQPAAKVFARTTECIPA